MPRPRVPLPLDEALKRLFKQEGITIVGSYPRWSADLRTGRFLAEKDGAYWTFSVNVRVDEAEREDALYDCVVQHLAERKRAPS